MLILWCRALIGSNFCANKIAESEKHNFYFPLVKMLLSTKETKPQEEIALGAKLTEFFFFAITQFGVLTKIAIYSRYKLPYLDKILYNILKPNKKIQQARQCK